MKVVNAAEVRSWAGSKGLEVADTRGRLPFAVVDAYNKAHRSKRYAVGGPAKTISVAVPATDSRGRNITKTVAVNAAELRAGIGAEGQRGRVSAAAAVEYVIGAGLV